MDSNAGYMPHSPSQPSPSDDPVMRIHLELIAAGITSHGLHKSETRYLPRIIRPTEHIGGVVYGEAAVGSVMLVATNERIIYLDKKFLFSIMDSISYHVIAGLRLIRQGPFMTVVLHTRIHDFTVKYANATCARNFEHYVATHTKAV
ncbi:MAG TPA: PH domain-containing protein [Candidatus Saccharimonadales bacterium]|nr:PH domain-containing protein [Candidatus Saccharimonadales bacterium]